MTTGRINQIATRQPKAWHRHPIDESPGTCMQSVLCRLGISPPSVNSFIRSFVTQPLRRPPFAHHPAPRFRGRDSRSRSLKTFTRDQQPFRSPFLDGTAIHLHGGMRPQRSDSLPTSGQHPGFVCLSPNDLEVSGKAGYRAHSFLGNAT